MRIAINKLIDREYRKRTADAIRHVRRSLRQPVTQAQYLPLAAQDYHKPANDMFHPGNWTGD